MNKRNKIKEAIWQERIDYSLDPPCPRCDICNNPLPCGPDMHEWLIRRGHLPRKKQKCIWHKYNCVLLCPTCHERADGMKDHFRNLQIQRYGRKAIEEWLESLPLRIGAILGGEDGD